MMPMDFNSIANLYLGTSFVLMIQLTMRTERRRNNNVPNARLYKRKKRLGWPNAPFDADRAIKPKVTKRLTEILLYVSEILRPNCQRRIQAQH